MSTLINVPHDSIGDAIYVIDLANDSAILTPHISWGIAAASWRRRALMALCVM
jgi:hypothetical protein